MNLIKLKLHIKIELIVFVMLCSAWVVGGAETTYRIENGIPQEKGWTITVILTSIGMIVGCTRSYQHLLEGQKTVSEKVDTIEKSVSFAENRLTEINGSMTKAHGIATLAVEKAEAAVLESRLGRADLKATIRKIPCLNPPMKQPRNCKAKKRY